jgi:hypothetical protein
LKWRTEKPLPDETVRYDAPVDGVLTIEPMQFRTLRLKFA